MDEGRHLVLADLPASVLCVILEALVGGGGGGGGTGTAVGSPRDVVHLAFTCKALLAAVAAAEQLWQQQCRKLGWSLAWLPTLPPGTTAWSYFCLRMATRHRLRRQLRTMARFLDPISAAAIRPAAGVQAIQEAEAALQAPLPFELFELYRWCDGQDRDRGGIQFFHEARLLSLREVLAAAQDRQGPLALAKAFAALTAGGSGEERGREAHSRGGGGQGSRGGGDLADGDPGGSGSGVAGGNPGSIGSSLACGDPAGSSGSALESSGAGGGSGGACCAAWPPGLEAGPGEPPEVLLPISDEIRGRRRYYCDLQGRIWLASGFFCHPAAPSLTSLLRRILT